MLYEVITIGDLRHYEKSLFILVAAVGGERAYIGLAETAMAGGDARSAADSYARLLKVV